MMLGLGLGLPALAAWQTLKGWSPAALFPPGTAGFCGGMSVTEAFDAGLMFQDSEGTTPAALEMPVGLVLGQVGSINASQTTSTKRPKLSARVNLLTKTEDFSAASWYGGGSTGATTLDFVNGPDKYTYPGIVAGVVYVFSFDLTLISGGPRLDVMSQGWASQSVTATTTKTRISVNLTAATTDGFIGFNKRDTGAFTVTNIDIRPANLGTDLPAYQRVNTATDYDSVGFPKYLEFDGTDDCLVTPSIDLTGTDAMTVFWGGYQPDSGLGMILELSTSTSANSGGAWLLTNYYVIGYNYASRGGTGGDIFNIEAKSARTPPAYSVVTGQTLLDAVDPDGSGTIRVNSVAGTPAVGPLGVGPLGNLPLFIGSRNQSAIFFNGRMYTLPIIVGRAVEPALIAEVEAHINAAMGGIY